MSGNSSQVTSNDRQPLPPSSSSSSCSSGVGCFDGEREKWGTHVMGAPAVPASHPANQHAAAYWTRNHNHIHNPYVYNDHTSTNNPTTSPMESILLKFNSWTRKAEITANNIWRNLNTGSSVSEAAWDKVNLTAKAITGGGFETLYKQTFSTFPYEKLKKTFACYLSTTTGPVAGTLYLSNVHLAFCSDRPLSFTAPSTQITWTYYKVIVPLAKIGAVNPILMRDNSSERYLQIVTVDGHDFWFMGFVNFEKAARHISESLGGFIASGVPLQPATSN